jgi:hypothetical protein
MQYCRNLNSVVLADPVDVVVPAHLVDLVDLADLAGDAARAAPRAGRGARLWSSRPTGGLS